MMQKRSFAKHAKSSAALVSLGVHALLIVIALSFVAVTVIQKEEKSFEAKPVSRPKMNLKKLQVPVNIKKKKVQKPKLRKRIVVNPKINRAMPDIKMPEITGIKGGMGSAGSGSLGGDAGLGFSAPEFEIFGIKSQGEKVFLILDSTPEIMYDELGGIPAYEIIKAEMLRVISELGATTLFNVAIYDKSKTMLLFPSMVPAHSINISKVKRWLDPLNTVHSNMKDDDYGVKTLGEGGNENLEDLRIGKFTESSWQGDWYRPAMLAMKQQADSIFLFTHDWGWQRYLIKLNTESWKKSSAGLRYMECYEKGKKLLAEENKQRLARGEAPRVVRDHPWHINKAYFPDIEYPPANEYYNFTPRDYTEAFLATRVQYHQEKIPLKSGLKRKSSSQIKDFSFNVVHFIKVDTGQPNEKLNKLARLCNGQYRSMQGLEAIKSHTKGSVE